MKLNPSEGLRSFVFVEEKMGGGYMLLLYIAVTICLLIG